MPTEPPVLTLEDLVRHLRALDGVVVEVASQATGAPPEAWGDVFASYDPGTGGASDRRFPFATVVRRDSDGARSLLDRAGVYRLNVGVGRARFTDLLGYAPSAAAERCAGVDFTVLDQLLPHPVYAAQAWVSILCPGRATADLARQLLCEAHARETGRHAVGTERRRSPQTLTERERRTVALWAADCVERALPHFEAEASGIDQPRVAVARARAYARGELDTAEEIRGRFGGGSAARHVEQPAAVAAARAAGQLSAVPHMGAHALGAAAYAVKAAGLAAADGDGDAAITAEVTWQLAQLAPPARAALQQLPAVGTDAAGPLGRGLLASGQLGEIVAALQAGIVASRP